jgi:hypothetical protein
MKDKSVNLIKVISTIILTIIITCTAILST